MMQRLNRTPRPAGASDESDGGSGSDDFVFGGGSGKQSVRGGCSSANENVATGDLCLPIECCEIGYDFKEKTLEWAASMDDSKPSPRLEFLKMFMGTLTENERKRLKKMASNRKRRVAKDNKLAKKSHQEEEKEAVNSSNDAVNSSDSKCPKKPWWEKYEKDDIVSWDSEHVSKLLLDDNGKPTRHYSQHPATIDIVNPKKESVYSRKIYHKTGSFRADKIWKHISGFNERTFDDRTFPKEDQVRKEVDNLLQGKLVITLGGVSDYNALNLDIEDYDHFDLQSHFFVTKTSERGKPIRENHSLRSLAKFYLNKEPQATRHSSFDDAVTTMELFEVYKKIKLQDDIENVDMRKNTTISYNEIPVLANPVNQLFPKVRKQ